SSGRDRRQWPPGPIYATSDTRSPYLPARLDLYPGDGHFAGSVSDVPTIEARLDISQRLEYRYDFAEDPELFRGPQRHHPGPALGARIALRHEQHATCAEV